MKKKILSLVLMATMGLSLLAGCGSSTTTSTDSSSTAESGDVDHIVVTWVYYTEAAPDLEAVTEAINEISIPEIGVEVEFMPISIGDTFTKYGTYIASGEQIDLMNIMFQDPLQYYNNGSIEPLNDLLSQYGSTITTLAEDYPITASVDGEVYGVAPLDPYYGSQGCIYVKEDYVDAITDLVSDDPDHVYSYDELTAIFAAIKEAYPDVYPLNLNGNEISSSSLLSSFVSGIEADKAGGDFGNGVFIGTDSETVVDYFETEEYYNYLVQVKEWADAGYVMPDAAVTDSTSTELLNSGVAATALTNYNPIILADEQANMGENCAILKTTEPYYTATAAASVCWTVPVTAANPEAAVKFLDLLYSNSEVTNLCMWGIEGTHYVTTDVEQVIAFPDGVTPENSGYYNTFGVWGDRRNCYVWSEVATSEPNEVFTNEAYSNKTAAGEINYIYDSTAMTNTIANIDTVITQYAPALECGTVSDLDATYNEFISALKAAGIDEVIADNQAQYDAAK